MNQAIENYLAELIATMPFIPAPAIFTGTSSSIRPPEFHAVLVLADSIETVLASLHLATIKIMVTSPTDDRVQHATLAQAVKDVMEGELPAASGFTVGGFRTRSHTTAVSDDDRWLTTIEGVLGLEWSAVDTTQ